MTATLDRNDEVSPTRSTPPAPNRRRTGWLGRPLWNRFTPLQCFVLAVATVAPSIVAANLLGGLVGLITTEVMIDNVLAAGEEPGMFTFAAMLLASPVQWLTGRTQVRVRKYLGIVFFLLGLANGAMFAIESGIGAALSEPFLIAGTLALAFAAPLFVTSSRRSQRAMGFKRWQLLHKATYLVAIALVAHVLLIGEVGISPVLIMLALALRVPPIRRELERVGSRDRTRAATASAPSRR
ncbi:MAG: ferric reductase-like transmembrane domain-containing protein [Actinomycetota bacterium]